MENKVSTSTKNSNASQITSGMKSIGERASDGLSKGAGSWTFIFGFLIFLGIWMAINVYAWTNTWDPYPFILLNLVLSCIAALQAPIILMSQNRQTEKDRRKAEYDYGVNRKSERGIEKILSRLERIERKINPMTKTFPKRALGTVNGVPLRTVTKTITKPATRQVTKNSLKR